MEPFCSGAPINDAVATLYESVLENLGNPRDGPPTPRREFDLRKRLR